METLAPGMLNSSVLQPYGRVRGLRLDSGAREIDLILDLNGEVEPITVHIQEYELVEDAGRMFLVIHRVSTSRAWLTALARNLAVGRRLELSPEVAKQVARFL